jgi:DNA repair protein RadA/Sms
MPKTKTAFVCQNCGAESPKWIGRCPSCKEWNTYHEEIVAPATPGRGNAFISNHEKRKPELLDNISPDEHARIRTGMRDLDRILGGGMVPGSLILWAVNQARQIDPALQLALILRGRTYFMFPERSEEQISLRAKKTRGQINAISIVKPNLKTYLHSLRI